MEFREVVRRRRMHRRFTAAPVDSAVVERMLGNAVRAPNAGFTQGWAFLVLDKLTDVERFWSVTAGEGEPSAWLAGMRTAPVLIVVLTSEAAYLRRYAEDDKAAGGRGGARWDVPYWHVDAGMAALLMLQTAVDEGLGACFFGVPAERVDGLRAAFGVPDEYATTGVIAVGHPDRVAVVSGSPRRRARRPLSEMVHRGDWGDHSDS